MSEQLPPRILVFCDLVEDECVARICGTKYFCEFCGDTEHKEIK